MNGYIRIGESEKYFNAKYSHRHFIDTVSHAVCKGLDKKILSPNKLNHTVFSTSVLLAATEKQF